MALFSKEIERNQLKLGDHIYSWRTAYIYAHHGIYVGEGKVIHFTRSAREGSGSGAPLDNIVVSSANPTYNPCPRCGYQSIHGGVLSWCIDCFLAGGNLYIFEYGVSLASFVAKGRGGTCTLAVSDPPEDVLHRASYLLQKENGFGVYHVFENNCVDFSIYCKTSLVVSTSISIDRSIRVATVAAAGSAILLLATSIGGMTGLGYGWYCVNRVLYDIGVRRDVIKISAEELVARAGSRST